MASKRSFFPIRHGAVALIVGAAAFVVPVPGRGAEETPITRIPDQSLDVASGAGDGILPVYAAPAFGLPHPEITRAVIFIHSQQRRGDQLFAMAEAVASVADEKTMVVVPQFLIGKDVEALKLSGPTLRWSANGWKGGEPAVAPADPVSSYAALDTVLRTVADPLLLPNLKTVVLAGHSAGGQMVQRYAIVGQAAGDLAARGLDLRFVVASPSSYLYFTADRPYSDAAACPERNQWRYGFEDPPPYVGGMRSGVLEQRYRGLDVVYLLGGADDRTDDPSLDVSCAALVQGPNRLARGKAFVRYLARRAGAPIHHLAIVPDVGHDGSGMFISPCGLAALLGKPGCPALNAPPVIEEPPPKPTAKPANPAETETGALASKDKPSDKQAAKPPEPGDDGETLGDPAITDPLAPIDPLSPPGVLRHKKAILNLQPAGKPAQPDPKPEGKGR